MRDHLTESDELTLRTNVKIAIFHNLAAGSDLWPSALGVGQDPDRDPARDYLPGDPMVRVFEGVVGLYRQRSGGIWIDAFQEGVNPHGQLSLDRADINFILSWVTAMTWTHVRAMMGAQLEAGRAYHGRRLRPLTRGDVAAVGEVPFVRAGPRAAKWEQLSWPFREVHQQLD